MGELHPNGAVVRDRGVPRSLHHVQRLIHRAVGIDEEVTGQAALVMKHLKAPCRCPVPVVVDDDLGQHLIQVFHGSDQPARRVGDSDGAGDGNGPGDIYKQDGNGDDGNEKCT